MIDLLKKKWHAPGGFREVLQIAFPLILSTGAHGLQMFTDRAFLANYEPNTMSASMQAGMIAFTVVSLFQGTIGYVNTFVAQYDGSKQYHRIGHAIWQGIFLAIFAGIVMLMLIPFSDAFFAWLGHAPDIQRHETTYFKIICYNAAPSLIAIAISSFFTGRGRTKLVMYITLFYTALNVGLDYCMIFGKLGLPAMGVSGAAWATVISSTIGVVLYIYFYFAPAYRTKFSTLKGCKPDLPLLFRIIRYGLPNGLHFFLTMICWSLFVYLAGRIGENEMLATTTAMQINSLSFMPMIGFAMAVSTLVGRRLGENKPHLAQQSTWSAFIMTMAYMTILAIGFVTIPNIFMKPFMISNAEALAVVKPTIRILLCFVSVHAVFNTANMMFSSALKGAGDTRFVMLTSTALCYALMAIPSWLAVKYNHGIYTIWLFSTFYVFVMAVTYFLRFMQGKWKSMRVIEMPIPAPPVNAPEVPAADFETL